MSSFSIKQNIPEAILDGIFSQEDLVDCEESKKEESKAEGTKVWQTSANLVFFCCKNVNDILSNVH